MPAAFAALRDGGVDLVTMANDHVLDSGQAGLADTLAAARRPGSRTSDRHGRRRRVGAYVTTVEGTRIAVLSVSQVAELASSWVATNSQPSEANEIDLGRTLEAVRTTRRLTPTVIVFVRWGAEGEACPDPNELSLARRLAAAGGSLHHRARARICWGRRLARPHLRRPTGSANFLWWEGPPARPPASWN